MGKLIVIDGLDGSGKTTQTELLYNELVSQGRNVRMLSFPRYDMPSGQLAKAYLQGELGKNAMEISPYAVSNLYAVDRFFSYYTDWKDFYQRTDSVILTTRYTTSNAIHQLAKLTREEWDGFLSWLCDFEYVKMGLPEPNMVIFLEMKPEISFDLVHRRTIETGQKPDIHENDIDLFRRFYKAGVYAADRFGWERITCHDGHEPLAIEDIARMVLEKATLCINTNK